MALIMAISTGEIKYVKNVLSLSISEGESGK